MQFKTARFTFAAQIALVSVLCAQISMTQKTEAQNAQSQPNYVPDEILAVLSSGVEKQELKDAVKDLHGTIVEEFGTSRHQYVRIKVEHRFFNESLIKMKRDKKFAAVQLNNLARKQRLFVPDDPNYNQQYQFKQMNVNAAWRERAHGRGVELGVIDDGVKGNQIDLAGRVERGTNIVTGGRGDIASGTHGTAVSTIAAASTNNDLLGAAPAFEVRIVPVDACNGKSTATDSDVLKSIQYLHQRGVKIINISLNGEPPDTYSNQADHEAIWTELRDYYADGGLVFNSAGNERLVDTNPRTRELVVVTATNSASEHASWSVTGSSIYFAAPGDQVGLSNTSNQFQLTDGTSFSTPLVASIAALVKGENPNLTNTQILDIMAQTATRPPGYTANAFGYGIPNAGAAVDMARRMR